MRSCVNRYYEEIKFGPKGSPNFTTSSSSRSIDLPSDRDNESANLERYDSDDDGMVAPQYKIASYAYAQSFLFPHALQHSSIQSSACRHESR